MLETRPKITLEREFVLAMSADIALSDYAEARRHPHPDARMDRRLRFRGGGEYLSISTAGSARWDGEQAPGGLKPRNTLLGLLVCGGSRQGADQHLPPGAAACTRCSSRNLLPRTATSISKAPPGKPG